MLGDAGDRRVADAARPPGVKLLLHQRVEGELIGLDLLIHLHQVVQDRQEVGARRGIDLPEGGQAEIHHRHPHGGPQALKDGGELLRLAGGDGVLLGGGFILHDADAPVGAEQHGDDEPAGAVRIVGGFDDLRRQRVDQHAGELDVVRREAADAVGNVVRLEAQRRSGRGLGKPKSAQQPAAVKDRSLLAALMAGCPAGLLARIEELGLEHRAIPAGVDGFDAVG